MIQLESPASKKKKKGPSLERESLLELESSLEFESSSLFEFEGLSLSPARYTSSLRPHTLH